MKVFLRPSFAQFIITNLKQWEIHFCILCSLRFLSNQLRYEPTFLSQIGHAIVHSKVLVIDPLSEDPVVVTGSHNFSASASGKNDESLVIVRGHKKLALAYAINVKSVYQHYRFRSYIREMLAQGKSPWTT